MGNFWKDLRHRIRMMSRNPGPTAVAVLILGFGIGADTMANNFFDAFGAQTFRGRSPDYEDPGIGIPVAVVGYDYWKWKGEEREQALKMLRIHGRLMTVAGIAPHGFTGSTALFSVDIYLPFGFHHLLAGNRPENMKELAECEFAALLPVAWLWPGMAIANADAQLSIVSVRSAQPRPAFSLLAACISARKASKTEFSPPKETPRVRFGCPDSRECCPWMDIGFQSLCFQKL